jgi:uracil-DNA glycosylase
METDLLKRLPNDWENLLSPNQTNTAWQNLIQSIGKKEVMAREQFGPSIVPSYENVFRALFLTPVNKTKVIILGQDPYHSPGLAQGLAFSIPESIKPGSREFPSSLRNISKALSIEGFPALANGNLDRWAEQGVLLLNATLTVELGLANAHADWGWQAFTDELIKNLSQQTNELVWLLWGSFAQKKHDLIDKTRNHLVLSASHPSGLSVYKTKQPFIYPGDTQSCEHFRQANDWLISHKKAPIAW